MKPRAPKRGWVAAYTDLEIRRVMALTCGHVVRQPKKLRAGQMVACRACFKEGRYD